MQTDTAKKTASEALDFLREVHELLRLNGENPFKIRAFERGQTVLENQSDFIERVEQGTLTELDGIGKGIEQALSEFVLEGKSDLRDELLENLPEGLTELVRVPGLGPKKARRLIEELGITSLSELEYACRENRLLKLKGFGEKAQATILMNTQFVQNSSGQLRLVDAIDWSNGFRKKLSSALKRTPEFMILQIENTGQLRRQCEVLDALEYLIELPEDADVEKRLREAVQGAVDGFQKKNSIQTPIRIHYAPKAEWGYHLAKTSSSPEHWQALGSPDVRSAGDEESFYQSFQVEFIEPELRETGDEVVLAQTQKLDVLGWKAIEGVFHNHTQASDGVNTLEEMVKGAKERGYRYIGISDHSRSMVIAGGLSAEELKTQKKEIARVQKKYPEVKIFWGIESDILKDGSLDYPDSVLKEFDFVIASIHRRYEADRETMTQRIIEAIRNPYTTMVGHLTGRLLLGRPGYDIDVERILAEAAAHQVVIEINAHPARMDLDWRWGKKVREFGTMVSVNPDAHSVEGLDDTRFGTLVARKALLPASLVLNSRSTGEVEDWLQSRKM